MWFKPAAAAGAENAEEEETHSSAVMDRILCMRPVLFDVFADHTVDPPLLNYVEMVMYCCTLQLLPCVISYGFFLQ